MSRLDPARFVRSVTDRVAATRRERGFTQEAAAERYGTALKNWQRIEAGQNLTLATLARVANVLGVTPLDLLGGGSARTAPARKRR